MKNKISVIILLSVLLSAPQLLSSQAISVPTEEQVYHSLEEKFEKEEVSEEQLLLFQEKSIQQIKDFFNAAEILSSPTLDSVFRKKLEETVIGYFSSPTDSLFFSKNEKTKGMTVETFLDEFKKGNLEMEEGTLSDFEMTTPVFLDKKYTWEVSFRFSREDTARGDLSATMILKKEKKSFGSVEKEVWDVKFEELKAEEQVWGWK
ncbi:MAG TPA: hypothetical protein ENJ53_11245 [Phaeodactylibacter sp.]|nr:hypothetical protein [Phaeodactylibacter sp.]